MGRGAKTREAILERAVALVSRGGLEGLAIGGLAKDLGLSKSGLIAHFGTKEALGLATLQAAAQLFGDTVILPALDAEPREARLRAFFDNWFRYAALKALPGGDVFFAATAELDDRPGVCRYYVARVQRDWAATIENATREAMQSGQFRAELDPGQIAFTILSILFGYSLYHRLLNAANAERRARASFESLMARARVPGREAPATAPAASHEDARLRAEPERATARARKARRGNGKARA